MIERGKDRKIVVDFCNEFLKVKDFKDFCINGLQVEGTKKIERIVTGVSFSLRLVEEAVKRRAQMIIVHHGLFGSQIESSPVIKGATKKRLKLLLENDINLCGYHLPLDANPIIGNNIGLCKLFGIKKLKSFDVGFIGEVDVKTSFDKFVISVNRKLQTKSFVLPAGPKFMKKIAVVSGGASSLLEKASEHGIDTFLTGDVKESLVRVIEELELNFINAGHYNTEKIGIINLGNLVAKKFKIKVEFIDIPCEI